MYATTCIFLIARWLRQAASRLVGVAGESVLRVLDIVFFTFYRFYRQPLLMVDQSVST